VLVARFLAVEEQPAMAKVAEMEEPAIVENLQLVWQPSPEKKLLEYRLVKRIGQ